MTGKELMYVEDVLGHEKFMKCCATKNSGMLSDPTLSNFVRDSMEKHSEIYNKFLNLL